MRSGIQSHDAIARIVREEAERYGWRGTTENVGVDPHERYFGSPKPVPWRGDVKVSHDGTGASVMFEYGLPEDEQEMRDQIRRVIRADLQDRERRSKPRAAGPIEV